MMDLAFAAGAGGVAGFVIGLLCCAAWAWRAMGGDE